MSKFVPGPIEDLCWRCSVFKIARESPLCSRNPRSAPTRKRHCSSGPGHRCRAQGLDHDIRNQVQQRCWLPQFQSLDRLRSGGLSKAKLPQSNLVTHPECRHQPDFREQWSRDKAGASICERARPLATTHCVLVGRNRCTDGPPVLAEDLLKVLLCASACGWNAGASQCPTGIEICMATYASTSRSPGGGGTAARQLMGTPLAWLCAHRGGSNYFRSFMERADVPRSSTRGFTCMSAFDCILNGGNTNSENNRPTESNCNEKRSACRCEQAKLSAPLPCGGTRTAGLLDPTGLPRAAVERGEGPKPTPLSRPSGGGGFKRPQELALALPPVRFVPGAEMLNDWDSPRGGGARSREWGIRHRCAAAHGRARATLTTASARACCKLQPVARLGTTSAQPARQRQASADLVSAREPAVSALVAMARVAGGSGLESPRTLTSAQPRKDDLPSCGIETQPPTTREARASAVA